MEFPARPPGTAYIGLENPRFTGDGAGRVYGVEFVCFDAQGLELVRDYVPFRAVPYYPMLSDLQHIVNQVNGGKIKRK